MRTIVISMISLACGDGHGAASEPLNAQEVLARLIESERSLSDIQAHIKCSSGGQVYREYDWGYDRGREFIRGIWQIPEGGGTASQAYAFDGEKEYHYMYQHEIERKTGLVTSYDPRNFHFFCTPKTLLGYSVIPARQESLGQSLSRAAQLTIGDTSCDIDGNQCCVIEALGVPAEPAIANVRVWIDQRRDYRPLKLEIYLNQNTPWERLRLRIDNIVLEEIGGIWLPVSGDEEHFTGRPVPSAKSQGGKDLVYGRLGLKRHIAADNIQINRGIDEQYFKGEFPHGCTVLDEFAGVTYVVGSDYRIASPLLDEGPLNIPPSTTVPQDHANLPTARSSKKQDAGRTALNTAPGSVGEENATAADRTYTSAGEKDGIGLPRRREPHRSHFGRLLSSVRRPLAWLFSIGAALGLAMYLRIRGKDAHRPDRKSRP